VNPSAQLNLLAALGYAVFERSTDESFHLLGATPPWLPAGPLTEAFPFLEAFLPDAEEFWANFPENHSTLTSDFWTQTGPTGEDLHFCAIAVPGERSLLLIECTGHRFAQTQAFVQYAHQTKLAHDEIARLSRELERATQAKSEFLARMSHEIRTPMNALLGVAELLSETALNSEQSEYVRIFRRAGDNLLNVINDILDFSKIEAGQVELECLAFDLSEVVQEAIEIIGVRARAKGLCLNAEIRPEVPPRLMGDPGRLRQILLNLLSNAVKFTDRGGITVRVERDREDTTALHFRVRDTGIGIPADRVSTIFDSFTQADASTTRKYGGTGLGLAISKRFVELMGGRIWAESAPGEGSTMHFTARFPVAEAAGVPKALAVKATVPPAFGNRVLRILLADDSEDNRFLVRGYLRDTGCVVDEVTNGAEVVEKFKDGIYDIVLMDAEMPVLDGYSATRAMRAFEKERGGLGLETPILALTAHALKEARDRSLEAGCTDHLTKPITKTALLEAISRYAPLPPAIEVESWLKPVIPAYLEKRRADVGKLRVALEQSDFDTVRTLGHQMAGSGSGYGFTAITEIGGAIEESAMAGDVARIRDGVGALERYLSQVVTD
jgi:signal transduction histidine kinase/CheY-like chemotaxis protein